VGDRGEFGPAEDEGASPADCARAIVLAALIVKVLADAVVTDAVLLLLLLPTGS